MRKYLLPSALILALGLSLAVAQTINKSIATSQDPTGAIGIDTANNVYFPAHVLAVGSAPTVTSCGVTGVLISGTDWYGQVTVGSSAATSCTITFAKPYLAAPACILAPSNGLIAAFSWTTSTTAITVTQTSTASDVFSYICSGAK
jgi:hypothetical protein